MRHPWLRRSMLHSMRLGCALAILLLSAVSALLVAAPVLAAGDTVALSLTNGSTFTYGGTAPKFTAVVTLGAAPTTSPTWQVKVTIAGGATFSNSSPPTKSSDGLTLTFTGLQPASPVPAGAHTATAEFTNPETSATVTSDPVSFTVNKAALNMACAIAMNGQNVIGVGKPITVQMTTASGKGSLPTEARTGGTFTVKLDGPTHTTSANLTANSVFAVTATAPAQNGIYTLTCIFNGSANYASASFTSNNPYTISSLHALGTVQLYSNPTTLTAGQKIDYYVVFHPASGLPTPSGQFTLSFGSHHTDAFTLGSAGTFLIYFGTISSLAGVTDIQVFYMGDVNYDQATVHFPLTNPAIPSGIDDGTSGNPQATTTTTTPTTAAETPGAETTPTAVSAAGALTAPPAGNGDNLGLILIVAAVIMLLIAGLGTGVGIIIYRMRQSGDHDDDAQGSYGYPAGYGQVGQIGRLGAYDDSGQYRPSGQYRNAGQYGRSGVYRQNGQANQAGQMGQMGQMGQSGLTGQTGRYRRPGQFGQSGQYRQPGQAGQAGQTSKHRQPGQYGPRGPFPDEETARFPRRDQ